MEDPLERKALEELQKGLKAQAQWIKVHSAEYLIGMGYSEQVKREFLHENLLHHSKPRYRIGIWRVLTEAEIGPDQKNQWIDKIFEAFGDRNGPDQLHAIETLAKLELSPIAKCPEATQNALKSEDGILKTFAIWATAYVSDQALKCNKQELLNIAVSDSDEKIRIISALGLRKLGSFTRAQWTFLAFKALLEPVESALRNSLLNTAFVSFQGESEETGTFRKIREEIQKGYKLFSFEKRIGLALSLAEKGTVAELPILQSFLNNEGIPGIYASKSMEAAEARAAAAFAILKIKNVSNRQHV